jgi:hypothetical protein
MNRDRVIALGLLDLHPHGDGARRQHGSIRDSAASSAVVLGAVLGVAFVWGEWERGRPREDQR